MGKFHNTLFIPRYVFITVFSFFLLSTLQAKLPPATQVASQMGIGWNLGNTLEAPDGETSWENPEVNKQLIEAVKQAGFNTIRIPCAWNSHADPETLKIDPVWMNRVQEIVDYAMDAGMYVILNSHWDRGWLEEHPLYEYQDEVNVKQAAYWTQIANHFKDYDHHLLFAGANEVRESYAPPTKENLVVLDSYHQTFVDAVRKTGGNNQTRTLIVQTYNTNILFGLEYFDLPKDSADGRLMVEVHHYDPYQFTLMNPTECPYWGIDYHCEGQKTWATEASIETLFKRIQQKWTNNGIPVVLGEYGVVSRTDYPDPRQIESRAYWLEFHTALAIECGIVPVYWDNGVAENGFALFDRETGKITDPVALQALMRGTGAVSAE